MTALRGLLFSPVGPTDLAHLPARFLRPPVYGPPVNFRSTNELDQTTE